MTTQNQEYICLSEVDLGNNVFISKFVNLYGCSIGNSTKIGAFVEIGKGASVGNNCKISSHSYICGGVTIQDGCFIGHGVVFTNDKFPRAVNKKGELETFQDWKGRFEPTLIQNNVSIGSNATILCGITIGAGSLVGAGSVVTKNIPPNEVWAGNPARFIKGLS